MVFLFQEINVSGRDDAHQLPTHFAIICYGDAAEAVASLGLEYIPYAFVWAHHYRVCDESLFITLQNKEGRKTNGTIALNTENGIFFSARKYSLKSSSLTLTFRTSLAWNSGVQLW